MTKTYLRRFEIVVDSDPMVSIGDLRKVFERVGVKIYWSGTGMACDTCQGRGYLDMGKMFEGNDCIRKSEKCPDCDHGRPLPNLSSASKETGTER